VARGSWWLAVAAKFQSSDILTASDEPPIHELQHLHWNCFLEKILACEPTTNRKFIGNTSDALIFKSDDNGILAARLVPNNISDLKTGVH
jgi:hypothetical protein